MLRMKSNNVILSKSASKLKSQERKQEVESLKG